MKLFKHVLSLLLALVLALSLCACTSAEDKAFEEADALLAAGDYEGAIAAFSAIGRYQEISTKIAEAEKLQNEANMGFLFGNWINVGTDASLVLNDDGTGTLVYGTETYNTAYTYENNTVALTQPMAINLKVEKQNGVTHLIAEGFSLNLVSEADYPAFAPTDIEITLDNWQEYFELKEVNSIRTNAFGEVSSVQPSIGIFLKEEYYSRLMDGYYTTDLSFELTYDEALYKVLNCDANDFNYDLAGQYERELVAGNNGWTLQTGCTAIAQIIDYRNGDWIPEQSPYYHTLSASIETAMFSSNDSKTVHIGGWANVQVSRVIGTLRLFPE